MRIIWGEGMFILFQVAKISIKKEEKTKFSKREQEVVKKFLDQIDLIPNKTKILDVKDTKNKIEEILEKQKKPDINVEGMILVLNEEEIKILESVFERLGYEFKAEALPEDHEYVKVWKNQFEAKNDIKAFFDYVYIGKEVEIPSSDVKPKSSLQVFDINLKAIKKKIDNVGEQISDLKEKYTDDKNNQREEIGEKQKLKADEQKKETNVSEFIIKQQIMVDSINFNKKADEKDESSYKIQKLVNELVEVEFQADLSQNVKNSNKKRSAELLDKINDAVKNYNIQFTYSNGYPKRIDKSDGKIWYAVKLEQKNIENENKERPLGFVYKNKVELGTGNNIVNFNQPINKNNPKSKYKIEVLVEGQEVEYNYAAFDKIKDEFLSTINNITENTGKKYRFTQDYPKHIEGTTKWKVKIEEVSEEKESKESNQIENKKMEVKPIQQEQKKLTYTEETKITAQNIISALNNYREQKKTSMEPRNFKLLNREINSQVAELEQLVKLLLPNRILIKSEGLETYFKVVNNEGMIEASLEVVGNSILKHIDELKGKSEQEIIQKLISNGLLRA